MVLPNMMAEFGAKSAFIAPNDEVIDYLAARLARRLSRAGVEAGQRRRDERSPMTCWPRRVPRSKPSVWTRTPARPMRRCIAIAAREIEPTVACPHSVDNVLPLSQVTGVQVQQAFLGTCTNGRLGDLAVAAQIVRGPPGGARHALPRDPRFGGGLAGCHAPRVYSDVGRGGAVIGVPGCGPCMGNHMGIPAPGETTISSANRNFRGRMGTPDADIYLASPAVVAASAILGRIADPARVGRRVRHGCDPRATPGSMAIM